MCKKMVSFFHDPPQTTPSSARRRRLRRVVDEAASLEKNVIIDITYILFILKKIH